MEWFKGCSGDRHNGQLVIYEGNDVGKGHTEGEDVRRSVAPDRAEHDSSSLKRSIEGR